MKDRPRVFTGLDIVFFALCGISLTFSKAIKRMNSLKKEELYFLLRSRITLNLQISMDVKPNQRGNCPLQNLALLAIRERAAWEAHPQKILFFFFKFWIKRCMLLVHSPCLSPHSLPLRFHMRSILAPTRRSMRCSFHCLLLHRQRIWTLQKKFRKGKRIRWYVVSTSALVHCNWTQKQTFAFFFLFAICLWPYFSSTSSFITAVSFSYCWTPILAIEAFSWKSPARQYTHKKGRGKTRSRRHTLFTEFFRAKAGLRRETPFTPLKIIGTTETCGSNYQFNRPQI